jgi:cytochrome c oxidase assembly protein subunit 15
MLTVKRFGYLALVLGFAQIVFGAVVRITGSGMGCGDHWPDCYGSFIPAQNAPNLLVEISHRYGAAALSLAILALAIAAWLNRKVPGVGGRGGVLRASLLAALLVLVAALFGAITVKMQLNTLVVVTHLAIAMSLLAVLVVVVVRAGGLGSTSAGAGSRRTLGSARAAVGLTFLALVFGALTANTPGAAVACQGFPWCSFADHGLPLWVHVTHRIIALLLLGHLIGISVGVRKRGEPAPIRNAAWAALAIVILQVLVAGAMVGMHFPASLRSLHQAVGTALWTVVVALAALGAGKRTHAGSSEIVRESPSRGEFATPEGVST